MSILGAMVIPDEILGIVVPILVYWVYSIFYEVVGSLERFQKYRIHSQSDLDAKNMVTKIDVVKGTLLQHAVQAGVVSLAYMVTGGSDPHTAHPQESWMVIAKQCFVAMLVVDTHNYFIHRFAHSNKFMYRHVHSVHHKLIVPYAFGAQYGHPLEALLQDTLAGALGFLVSGMSPRTSIFFFSFTNIKSVDDHCGIRLPWNPFHLLFWNNTAYHEVHHFYGHRYNYSQPFFITWDKILGTYKPCNLEKREGGGYKTRVN